MMKRVLLLLLSLLTFAAPAFGATKLRCSKLVAESVSASTALDANVLVQFTPGHAKALADEDHSVEVRFFGPQGFLYESRRLPLTSVPERAADTRHFVGYARPIARKLVAPSKSGKELEVSVPLPVAATSIVSNAMYGTWRAEAYLDDSREPCAEVTFTIAQ